MRPRNLGLETRLTRLAARSVGFIAQDSKGEPVGDDGGLSSFANARALPGGIREDADFVREIQEEIADARNYAVWAIEPIHDAYMRGESEAGDVYAKHMRALSHLMQAWHALGDH